MTQIWAVFILYLKSLNNLSELKTDFYATWGLEIQVDIEQED